MKDTREARDMLVIALTAAVGAIVGQKIVQPWLERTVK